MFCKIVPTLKFVMMTVFTSFICSTRHTLIFKEIKNEKEKALRIVGGGGGD